MSRDLPAELVKTLGSWQGAHVAVRVVARNDELVAVFSGSLGAPSAEKGMSLFWPIEPDGVVPATLERPGIYAHPELLSDVRTHVGDLVVEFTEADVTVNVRRLDHSIA